MDYQLLIIGDSKDAIRTAIAAAERGQRVAVVEMPADDAEISTEILREAAESVIEQGRPTLSALRSVATRLQACRRAADREELSFWGVDVLRGSVQFLNANKIVLGTDDEIVTAESIVLACSTKSDDDSSFSIDGNCAVSVQALLSQRELPQSLVIVGAGRTGLDLALIFARLGVEVTVVDEHTSAISLCTDLIGNSRLFEVQSLNVAVRLGDEVIGVKTAPNGTAVTHLASGKRLHSDMVVSCTARRGNTEGMDLHRAGVGLDERGRVWCDRSGQTWAPNIRAVGDVVGFQAPKNAVGSAMA